MRLLQWIHSLFSKEDTKNQYLAIDYALQLHTQEKQLAAQNDIIELVLLYFRRNKLKLIEASSIHFKFLVSGHPVSTEVNFRLKIEERHCKDGRLTVTYNVNGSSESHSTLFTFTRYSRCKTKISRLEQNKIDSWFYYHALLSLEPTPKESKE